MRFRLASILAAALALPASADAQQTPLESYSFENGALTIEVARDQERVLSFNGRELARNYQVTLNQIAGVNGMSVAVFSVGNGDALCGPASVIVWKPKGGEVKAETVGEKCGSPPPAIARDGIYFVPYLLPGASGVVEKWSPEKGLRTIGALSFAPQPGTDWPDLDPAGFDSVVDALSNEAVYAASKKLLVDKLPEVVTGLLAAAGTQSLGSGIFYSSGCVGEECNPGDAFMAIDVDAHSLYFAELSDGARIAAWPRIKNWPAEIRQAMRKALTPEKPQ